MTYHFLPSTIWLHQAILKEESGFSESVISQICISLCNTPWHLSQKVYGPDVHVPTNVRSAAQELIARKMMQKNLFMMRANRRKKKGNKTNISG